VDGTRNVQAVIDSSGMAEFEVCRVLFDLLNRNIISTVGRGTNREAAAAGRAEAPPSSTPAYAALALVGVLALGGLLARLPVPFAVTGLKPMLKDSYALLLEGVRRARMERLDRAIVAYSLVHGTPPKTLADLVSDGLVDPSFLRDPWGRPFHFALTDNGFLLNALDDASRAVPGTVIERALPPAKP
jgi:hypothetical protein